MVALLAGIASDIAARHSSASKGYAASSVMCSR